MAQQTEQQLVDIVIQRLQKRQREQFNTPQPPDFDYVKESVRRTFQDQDLPLNEQELDQEVQRLMTPVDSNTAIASPLPKTGTSFLDEPNLDEYRTCFFTAVKDPHQRMKRAEKSLLGYRPYLDEEHVSFLNKNFWTAMEYFGEILVIAGVITIALPLIANIVFPMSLIAYVSLCIIIFISVIAIQFKEAIFSSWYRRIFYSRLKKWKGLDKSRQKYMSLYHHLTATYPRLDLERAHSSWPTDKDYDPYGFVEFDSQTFKMIQTVQANPVALKIMRQWYPDGQLAQMRQCELLALWDYVIHIYKPGHTKV